MQLKLSLYALALDGQRCVVCLDVDGSVDPVCVITLAQAMERGLAIRQGREQEALRLAEELARRDAQAAIDAAKAGKA